jgi:hypothetical protein
VMVGVFWGHDPVIYHIRHSSRSSLWASRSTRGTGTAADAQEFSL